MNRIFCALAIFSSLLIFSCKKNASVASVKRQELFSLKYGSFEEQLNMAGGLNATGAVNTAIAMRDGFFYVSNGESKKILELNSYGHTALCIPSHRLRAHHLLLIEN